MRKLLKTAITDVKKLKSNGTEKSLNVVQENIRSLIIKNIDKFENEEILKIIKKYNENDYKDYKILKCSYDFFKNNVHRYSFDQINRVLRLYHKSEMHDNQFNTSIFNYLIKRLNGMPPDVTANVFHNLVRSGLRDYRNINSVKEHIVKNMHSYNTLDLTIILSSFTILQEEFLIRNSSKSFVSENTNDFTSKGSVCPPLDYSNIVTIILNKIKNDENIHNNLSVVNSILILNMISRININNYEIFKFFTKKYYKKLKEKDVEPYHLTLLLNSFAKCNININILKYIINHMNKDNFINQLSYVNITNAVHYMAKFNYKNIDFLNRLKKKVLEIIDNIPQREFSNIMWSLSKLKIKDNTFYYLSLQKIKRIIQSMDMMSIAQVLDALRRQKNFMHEPSLIEDNVLQNGNYKNNPICEYPQCDEDSTKVKSPMVNKNMQKREKKGPSITKEDEGKHINGDLIRRRKKKDREEMEETLQLGQTNNRSVEMIKGKVDLYNISDELENEVIDLLIQKYMENLESCSLHVLTQVPFCCLQLNCTNYDVYHKSLEILKRKREHMSTLNLIYARYFIRILIEKQENNFQKLPRSLKQFAKEIMNSDK
ncbi:conserved Plasmodium protein, unknown function [Plasmodium ovale]|uniref:Uncharacterized protein n=2 Tax=Plasmodium ovale TaxID=36330 RepID=A0A1A8W480_PLAOA|nr:hypothetical protein POVCU2_0039180 [Plasmodium ovale curtisi]SCP05849.1 conserved Plasmodium protein, unknown function [Plasmodium ovale]